MKKHNLVYALVCETYDENQNRIDFIVGIYASEIKANDNLRQVEQEAKEDGQDLYYRIDKYEVIE